MMALIVALTDRAISENLDWSNSSLCFLFNAFISCLSVLKSVIILHVFFSDPCWLYRVLDSDIARIIAISGSYRSLSNSHLSIFCMF